MPTQIAFVGGERVGVVQQVEDVVQSLAREASSAGLSFSELTREDRTPIHVNPEHVMYVRGLPG